MNGSPEEREEETLRRQFASFAAEVPAPEALYEKVRSRRRLHRRRSVTAMAAAVAVVAAVAVPTVGLRTFSGSDPQKSAHEKPVEKGVRGSLGGDEELLKAATTVATAKLMKVYGKPGSAASYQWGDKAYPGEVDPTSVRPFYAERAGDYEVVAFVALNRHGRRTFTVQTVRPRAGQWTALDIQMGGLTDKPRDDKLSPREAQERYLGPDVVDLVEGGPLPKPLVMVVASSDVTAQIAYRADVTAEPRLQPAYQPLKLTEGTALATANDDSLGTWVRLSRGNSVVVERSLATTHGGLGRKSPPVLGTAYRGSVTDKKLVTFAILRTAWELRRAGLQTPDPQVVWGGNTAAGDQTAVTAVRFPSGAQAAFLLVSSRHGYTWSSKLVLPGSFETQAFTFAYSDGYYGNRYVIVGPRNAVRAEIDLPGGRTERVTLDEGGGILELPKSSKASDQANVRVYDRAGKLLDERRAEEGSADLQRR